MIDKCQEAERSGISHTPIVPRIPKIVARPSSETPGRCQPKWMSRRSLKPIVKAISAFEGMRSSQDSQDMSTTAKGTFTTAVYQERMTRMTSRGVA